MWCARISYLKHLETSWLDTPLICALMVSYGFCFLTFAILNVDSKQQDIKTSFWKYLGSAGCHSAPRFVYEATGAPVDSINVCGILVDRSRSQSVRSPFEVRSNLTSSPGATKMTCRWHADDMPSFSSSTVYVVHSCLLAMCQRQQSAFWLESKFRPVIGGHAGKSVLPLFSQDREDLTQWCECNSKVISFLIAVLSRNNVARGNFTTTSWTGVL